jgi:hypothetical protein
MLHRQSSSTPTMSSSASTLTVGPSPRLPLYLPLSWLGLRNHMFTALHLDDLSNLSHLLSRIASPEMGCEDVSFTGMWTTLCNWNTARHVNNVEIFEVIILLFYGFLRPHSFKGILKELWNNWFLWKVSYKFCFTVCNKENKNTETKKSFPWQLISQERKHHSDDIKKKNMRHLR